MLPSWIPSGIFELESLSVFPESNGITISGLITPALICVAPFIEAALPSFSFSSEKVASLIGIDPYPSVTIRAVFNFSVPVIATPRLYPSIAFKS